ncbi:hypothetical protein R3W88_000873 [Solanum pinnatisectum]|uniref:Uncharacterized protein n=1 Tax=Solanum pinnatisectum TaxID=50273 RepID=A0AAV9MH98_9SOLN|nr:hypothetical protein R3W88_000873 [Solanum pinnatisectum]
MIKLAVLTRSGKAVGGDVTSKEGNDTIDVEGSGQEPENDTPTEVDEALEQLINGELQTSNEGVTSLSKPTKLLPKINSPFPQRLKKRDKDAKFQKFLFVFKTLSINLSLVEALLEMSGFAKFMKELVTKKMSMDFETVEVSHSCSAIMTNNVVIKKADPGAFTIPCTNGMIQFAKALCDLGISINLMPYSIFKQLGLGEPKSTTMRLLMADRSIKHPIVIRYDILVKRDMFLFSADFVILDCEIDAKVPIILGRPFLPTRRALVDVESGELKFRVNDEEVTFNLCKSMKKPSDIHVVSTIDVIDEAVASMSEVFYMGKLLAAVVLNYDEEEIQDYDEVVAALSGIWSHSNNPLKMTLI